MISACDFRRCRGAKGSKYEAASAGGSQRDSDARGLGAQTVLTEWYLGPRPWVGLGYKEEMRSPSRQE